jgi:anti-anti-sigma regulatory factor
MGIALSQSDEASVLRLDGSVDIASAAELKTALLEAIAAGKPVRVAVEEVTELDVAAFQLLWAAGRQAEREGIGFGVTGPLAAPVRAALSAIGLDVRALSREPEPARICNSVS